jgi:hypothetical protein
MHPSYPLLILASQRNTIPHLNSYLCLSIYVTQLALEALLSMPGETPLASDVALAAEEAGRRGEVTQE